MEDLWICAELFGHWAPTPVIIFTEVYEVFSTLFRKKPEKQQQQKKPYQTKHTRPTDSCFQFR